MPYPENLKESLKKHLVDEKIINEIYEGYEDIGDKSPKKEKIEFMRHAMNIIDKRLSYEKRYEVIDSCACCLGGAREKNVKKFAKSIEGKNLTLAEKVQALKEAHPFQNYLTCLKEDGIIRDGIWYEVDGKYKCACTCLNKEVVSSAIESMERKPCIFSFEIIKE